MGLCFQYDPLENSFIPVASYSGQNAPISHLKKHWGGEGTKGNV